MVKSKFEKWQTTVKLVQLNTFKRQVKPSSLTEKRLNV